MKNILIYSRKSKFTGRGDSVENQIQMCQEYARLHEDEEPRFFVYEDEGFSGKNTARPQFQRMLGEMRTGAFDMLICYRLDRVSRSVSDFSALLEELEAHGTAFVSIREHFDTSTPMGRAMIQIAAVFAQLERETIAERIRDNKYRQYRSGHWQGGVPPLGYRSVPVSQVDSQGSKRSHHQLQVVPEQARLVALLFDKYLALGSYTKLEGYLLAHHIPTPRGSDFGRAGLRVLLGNPVYAVNDPCVYRYLEAQGADLANPMDDYDGTRGLVAYGKTVTTNSRLSTRATADTSRWIVAVADHQGIVPGEQWVEVQTLRERRRPTAGPRSQTSALALLSGLIRCEKCGSPMEIMGNRTYADGTPGFYYGCTCKRTSRGTRCNNSNLHGPRFDAAVVQRLQAELAKAPPSPEDLERELFRARAPRQDQAKAIRQLEASLADSRQAGEQLARKLAASTTPQDDRLIYQAMAALQAQGEELEAALAHARQAQAKAVSQAGDQGWGLVLEAYSHFVAALDTMPLEAKRGVVHSMVRRIGWDGQTATIYLAAGGSQ